ncbi:E3 ubiquitin- ligase RNF180 isoform X1 [Pelobates cultripes]|uniref:E3 ubiquitin-protein ligase RNF180 n=2 Tax=Pelobates cultripes TaxID=61616 RepID=A0AAD1SCY5_PELCU|nr:E3 ubiquitin- ligase RNF180 isoform X1 [Pelobates cultripes]
MERSTMINEEAKYILRCRKCRNCVSNSNCLIIDPARTPNQYSSGSTMHHSNCPIWHMNEDAVPDWIKQEVEKRHWTHGRLNCPYCGARLGAFNFIGSTKNPCGQLSVVHLSKSRIDYDISHSPKPFFELLPIFKAPTSLDKKKKYGLNRSEKQLTMNTNMDSTGSLVEALCLEIRSHNGHFMPRRKKLPLTDFCLAAYSDKKDTGASHLCTNVFVKTSNTSVCRNKELLETQPAQYLSKSKSELSFENSNSQSTNESFRKFTGKHRFDIDKTLRRPPESVPTASDPPVPMDSRTQYSHTVEVSESIGNTPSVSATRDDYMQQQLVLSSEVIQSAPTCTDTVTHRLSKREINKLKSIRRKQKKREKWLQEQKKTNRVSQSTDDDGNEHTNDKESYICAVCLDVYFNPYMCYPCHHIFCEPCLRTLARDNPARTSCPLCRTTIERVYFQSDLDKSAITFFPRDYLKRKQSFQRASCAKWPLPCCNRIFRVFGGFSRNASIVGRRQYPHGAQMLGFEDETRGWRFDMDMVIVYIYSVNWVIGLIIFCFLFYFLFHSS